jgi:hypothetical protein
VPRQPVLEITVPMSVNVDGAPNAYGPDDHNALDYELNAHTGAVTTGSIVGYLTQADGRTPIVQGPDDPCPGFYVSTTRYFDRKNKRETDPRRYVNAAKVNFVVRASAAAAKGVAMGDVCVVRSISKGKTVIALVADTGNSSGAEGSLALLQNLGYSVKNGKSGGVDEKDIIVRYFTGTNPAQAFFFTQQELDAFAGTLDLKLDFPPA